MKFNSDSRTKSCTDHYELQPRSHELTFQKRKSDVKETQILHVNRISVAVTRGNTGNKAQKCNEKHR